jgi:hypothetical protein
MTSSFCLNLQNVNLLSTHVSSLQNINNNHCFHHASLSYFSVIFGINSTCPAGMHACAHTHTHTYMKEVQHYKHYKICSDVILCALQKSCITCSSGQCIWNCVTHFSATLKEVYILQPTCFSFLFCNLHSHPSSFLLSVAHTSTVWSKLFLLLEQSV